MQHNTLKRLRAAVRRPLPTRRIEEGGQGGGGDDEAHTEVRQQRCSGQQGNVEARCQEQGAVGGQAPRREGLGGGVDLHRAGRRGRASPCQQLRTPCLLPGS